jgi:two-component system LytT family sensor kinase
MPDSILTKKFTANLVFVFGCLTIPSVVAASQAYIWALPGKPDSFWPYLLGSMILWYYWGILTPLILWLSRKYSFDKKRWMGSLAMHLIFWMLFSIPEICLSVLVYKHIFHLVDPLSTYFQIFENFIVGKMQLEFITYGCIVGACFAYDYRKKFIEREVYALQLQMQLTKAELNALKMQLQPHFLFNTLNTIAMLIRFNNNKTAVLTINGLSELLRKSLEQNGTQQVTLKEELELTDCYLEIEKIRFQDQISITKSIEPDALSTMVPNLILQPLVENAIRHGAAQRKSGGLVEINAWRENGTLNLEVKDNGPGSSSNQPNGNGIGLANTQERLHHLYGASHVFKISRDNGFSVLISIPSTELSHE